jgi:hypothetical protein
MLFRSVWSGWGSGSLAGAPPPRVSCHSQRPPEMAAEGLGAPAGPLFNDSSRDGFPSNAGCASVRDKSQSREANEVTTYWGLPCHVCGKMIRLMEAESRGPKKVRVATPNPDPFVVHCPDCQSRQTVESIELMIFDGPLDLAFRPHPAFHRY